MYAPHQQVQDKTASTAFEGVSTPDIMAAAVITATAVVVRVTPDQRPLMPEQQPSRLLLSSLEQ